MGSVYSSIRRNDRPNCFKVVNIDNSGFEIKCGNLEIIDHNLVLHKRRSSTIVWPLNTVRRYGYEENLFCFEVGRASPYGQGIYAFKCKKAKNIYETMKKNMEINCIMDQANSSTTELHNHMDKSLTHPKKIEQITDQVNFNELRYLEEFNSTFQLLPIENHYMNNPSDGNNEVNHDSYETLLYEEPQYVTPQYEISPYDQIIYTEIEIVPCKDFKCQRKSLNTSPNEPSSYTIVDFKSTMNLSKKMFRGYDNPGSRKTRLDYEQYI